MKINGTRNKDADELVVKVFEKFNEFSVKKSRSIGANRHKMIQKALKTYGEEEVFRVLGLIKCGNFLNKKENNWFNIDWVFIPRNFDKIADGNYNREDDYFESEEKRTYIVTVIDGANLAVKAYDVEEAKFLVQKHLGKDVNMIVNLLDAILIN